MSPEVGLNPERGLKEEEEENDMITTERQDQRAFTHKMVWSCRLDQVFGKLSHVYQSINRSHTSICMMF